MLTAYSLSLGTFQSTKALKNQKHTAYDTNGCSFSQSYIDDLESDQSVTKCYKRCTKGIYVLPLFYPPRMATY